MGVVMKKVVVLMIVLVCCGAVVAEANDWSCQEIKTGMIGQKYVAKKPLYDTVIFRNGRIDLEWDKEEIPEGATCQVVDVDCGRKKVEVTLRQVVGARFLDKVDIYFKIRRAERETPEGMKDYWVMVDLVLEKQEKTTP